MNNMKNCCLLFFVFLSFSELALAGRTINSATVDGASTTTVSASTTISVSLNVTTDGSGDDRHWKSTGWRIAGASGSLTCENHSNHTGSDTYDETFDITAPSTDGTYNLYLVAYKDNSCSSGASSEFELSNAVTTSESSSCTSDNVRDNFSTVSYSNNDGSQNWAASWQEIGESDGVSAGQARVNNSNCSSGNCLRIGTPSGVSAGQYTDRGVSREVDLSNASSATLTFNYFTGYSDGTANVSLEVSNDGGSNWTPLQNYIINSTNFTANPENFDLTSYIAENTQIRFIGSGSSGSNTGMYIDDINIDYCKSVSSNSCTSIPSDYALYSGGSIDIQDSTISVNGNSVSTGNYSPEVAIDKNGNLTTNVNLTLPDIDPASFPSNSATNDVISNGTININETSEAFYDIIRTKKSNRTINFTGGGPFHIDTLQTDLEDQTINFAAGTYYINNLNFLEVRNTINVTSSPVIIHVGNSFSFAKKDSDVNVGGSIDDFIVFLHSGSSFSTGEENLDFTGIIYGPSANVTIGEKDSSIRGPVIIGGNITIAKENFQLTYTDADKAKVDALDTCDSALDHFELSYAANGITCLASPITLKACANADCSSLYTENVDVTLDPATGWVSNPVTVSSGSASLELQHTTVEDVVVDITASSVTPTGALQCIADGTADATCTINFAEAGFVFDIPTQTACKPSVDVTIAAVKKSNITDQCVGALTGTQSVSFWSTYSSPATGTNTIDISGTTIDTSSPGTGVDLDFDINGEATFTVQYDDAGQVQIDASHTTNSGIVLTGNDNFVSKPLLLTVYTDENNFECISGDASCSRFKKAGETFDLKVNAACWESDSDSDFRDNAVTPNFELSSISVIPSLVAPSGGANGSLSVTSFNFTTSDNGTHTMEQTISEVGVFNFAISPSNYFGESLITQNSPNIGRFYPDHFEITSTANGAFGDNACGTFTYSGQNFSYTSNPSLTITAYNAAGTPAITQNYTGDFIQLVASDFIVTSPTSDANQLGADNTNLVSLSWAPAAASLTDNNNGSLDFAFGNDTYNYQHLSNSLIAPFNNAVNLVFTTITDDDGVQTQALPVTLQPSGEPIRFGRIAINNAHGSELVPLPVTIQAEYFNGANWQVNTADQCTTLNLTTDIRLRNTETTSNAWQAGNTTMTIASGTSTASLINNNPLVAGNATLTLAAPGEDNQGYVEIGSNIAANYDWLLGDYDNDGGYDDEAVGRGSFGLFKGSDNIIFRREVY